jgi:hypothetical protein
MEGGISNVLGEVFARQKLQSIKTARMPFL